MKASEIRAEEARTSTDVFLREIAAQLAEMNERQGAHDEPAHGPALPYATYAKEPHW